MKRGSVGGKVLVDLTIPGQWVAGIPKRYEVVDGRVVAKPYLYVHTSFLRSDLMMRIYDAIGEDRAGILIYSALFRLRSNECLRRPDLAFISAERWPPRKRPPDAEAWDVVPDLVAEFVGPRDRVAGSLQRVHDYFAAGVRLVWIFTPDHRQVYVYRSPKAVQILDRTDILDGGDVLPDFRVALADLFETEADGPLTEGIGEARPG